MSLDLAHLTSKYKVEHIAQITSDPNYSKPMKIIIEGCDDLAICSLEDLSKLIPSNLNGKPLNYGQGEGQFEIEDTIWGIYYGKNNTCILQFEEGVIEWLVLQKIVLALMENISDRFGQALKFYIKGCLD